MTCPTASREPVMEELSGHRVADPYRWLEDATHPRTRTFVAAQDEYFHAVRATWPGRDEWRRTVVDHSQPRLVSPPVIRGGRRFSLTHDARASAPRLVVTDAETGHSGEIDLGSLQPADERSVVRGFRPSWEGDRLVCMVSSSGSDQVSQHVLDTATGARVEKPLGLLPSASVAWLPGGDAFYYVASTTAPAGDGRSDVTPCQEVRLHRVGSDPSADPVVFPASEPGTYYGLTADPAGRWLALTVSPGAASHNALWLASLTAGDGASTWRPVTGDELGAAVAPRFGFDGRLYLMTDAGAPRGRVCVVDPDRPLPECWREVVPEDGEAVLDDCVLIRTDTAPYALALRTRHGVSELSVHDPSGSAAPVPVALPGAGVLSALRACPRTGGEVWTVYADFVTPRTLYRFDAASRRLSECADSPSRPRPAVPAPAAASAGPGRAPNASAGPRVRSSMVEYAAGDGTIVRMFLVSPDEEEPGPRPTVISGYGGFGVPLRPAYSPLILAWAAAGGHYALACVRGGGEEGAAWHEAGRGRNKSVAVDDFTAAAQWLVREKYTEPEMLAAAGASHGGFLVAASAMDRPDLYAAVLCSDPLLDLVRYEQLGIGATWTEEFGSAADPEQLANLLRISPYHQVSAGTSYPAVLFSGGTEDPRLDAAHVRKMCAALQYATDGGRTSPVVMRREEGVGHGTRTWESTVELNADTLAFLAFQTGLRSPAPPAAGHGSGLL